MIVHIDDQQVEVNPINLEIQDSDFVVYDQSVVREAVTRQILYDALIVPAWQTEPVPCGISSILKAAEKLEAITLLACHYDLYMEVKGVHQKLCSHMVECIPDGACEREMAVEAARLLCRIQDTLKKFHDHEHLTNSDE